MYNRENACYVTVGGSNTAQKQRNNTHVHTHTQSKISKSFCMIDCTNRFNKKSFYRLLKANKIKSLFKVVVLCLS